MDSDLRGSYAAAAAARRRHSHSFKGVRNHIFTLLDGSSSARHTEEAAEALEKADFTKLSSESLFLLKSSAVVLLYSDRDAAAATAATLISKLLDANEPWPELATAIKHRIKIGNLDLVLFLAGSLPGVNHFIETYVFPSVQRYPIQFQKGVMEKFGIGLEHNLLSLLSRTFSLKKVEGLNYEKMLEAAVDFALTGVNDEKDFNAAAYDSPAILSPSTTDVEKNVYTAAVDSPAILSPSATDVEKDFNAAAYDSPATLSPSATDVEKAAIAHNVAACVATKKAKFSVNISNKLIRLIDGLRKAGLVEAASCVNTALGDMIIGKD